MIVIQTKRTFLFLLLLLLLGFYTNAQSKIDTVIYFNLSTVKYDKSEINHVVQLKTKRNVHVYTFTIPCNCITGGAIGFGGHDNPETGDIYDPIKTISASSKKSLSFIAFPKLISFLKAHNSVKGYRLYFIEKRKKEYYQYHVRMIGSFYEE
jgi:hypothetical protein